MNATILWGISWYGTTDVIIVNSLCLVSRARCHGAFDHNLPMAFLIATRDASRMSTIPTKYIGDGVLLPSLV